MKTLALFCAAALAVPLARAAPRDISAEIAALRPSIVSAKVYHLSDSASYRTRRKEGDVAKGCYYAATGSDLTALLDVLVTGGLHETTPSWRVFEVRTVVYLAKQDGGMVPLLLNLRSPGSPSYGTYQGDVPVEAAPPLSAALHDWMSPRALTSPDSESCARLIQLD